MFAAVLAHLQYWVASQLKTWSGLVVGFGASLRDLIYYLQILIWQKGQGKLLWCWLRPGPWLLTCSQLTNAETVMFAVW